MTQEYKKWIGDVFDRISPTYGEEGCNFFEYFGEKLVILANLKAGAHILDVATGKGAVLFPAAKAVGPEGLAVGIDLSSKMIQEARKQVPFDWIDLHQMDAERLLFADHSFDVVFCGFALFFFPNLTKALAEFKRVQKSDGYLAVSVWGPRSKLHTWLKKRAKKLGATQELLKNPLDSADALREALTKAGFTQIDIQEEEKEFEHASAEDWWKSLWTHGTRAWFEQLSPENLEILKQEALAKAGSGKVVDKRRAFYAIAKE